MKGWLLDTHIVSALANPNGAPSVKAWATAQPEHRMYLSVLTLAEYDKGIHNLEPDHPDRSRYVAARDALAERFSNRLLSIDDAIGYRWGAISGEVKRRTGQSPPVIDTLLTATAIEHDLFLVTRNVKDTRHSGAAIFNPWEDEPSRFPLT
ncbi:type II toxin-antitoxin system VapC family toxin [Sphingopyxis indica]|uniref:type II toxin-antitoxin system VapC family toxin n=1 Tax=Sphingopyxis indica TaxID=436663 RepID=UPI002939402E|nr:type II toxin-antitoxin system VapC family toxin [Sphingopyxis indica]WOF45035.1 type II toxin-antitoxin system VapC family toxin [Sphingopyxis indica]